MTIHKPYPIIPSTFVEPFSGYWTPYPQKIDHLNHWVHGSLLQSLLIARAINNSNRPWPSRCPASWLSQWSWDWFQSHQLEDWGRLQALGRSNAPFRHDLGRKPKFVACSAYEAVQGCLRLKQSKNRSKLSQFGCGPGVHLSQLSCLGSIQNPSTPTCSNQHGLGTWKLAPVCIIIIIPWFRTSFCHFMSPTHGEDDSGGFVFCQSHPSHPHQNPSTWHRWVLARDTNRWSLCLRPPWRWGSSVPPRSWPSRLGSDPLTWSSINVCVPIL